MAGQGSALAMTAAYVLAGELAETGGQHDEAFNRYETLLRAFIDSKQNGAERSRPPLRREPGLGCSCAIL
jgi:2-polyprenyl-6-methoxyphenol hydroxylase-like FAD-dependent oxidoreductase